MSKVHTINGIPYIVNDTNEAILYGSNPPLRIGTTDAKKTTITLDDNWQVNAALTLTKYRNELHELTKASLEKAKQLQNTK